MWYSSLELEEAKAMENIQPFSMGKAARTALWNWNSKKKLLKLIFTLLQCFPNSPTFLKTFLPKTISMEFNSKKTLHLLHFSSPYLLSIPNHGFQFQIPKETHCFPLPLQSLHHPFLRCSFHRSHSISPPYLHHLRLLSLCLHHSSELMVRRSSRCSIFLESPSFWWR